MKIYTFCRFSTNILNFYRFLQIFSFFIKNVCIFNIGMNFKGWNDHFWRFYRRIDFYLSISMLEKTEAKYRLFSKLYNKNSFLQAILKSAYILPLFFSNIQIESPYFTKKINPSIKLSKIIILAWKFISILKMHIFLRKIKILAKIDENSRYWSKNGKKCKFS